MRIRTLAVLACLFACAPAAAAQDVIPSLRRVKGLEAFDGPASGKRLLKRNGFVVVPRFYHRIFSPYVHSKLPHYVTADSVFRTFHVIFEDQIKKVETGFAEEAKALSEATLDAVEQAAARDGTSPEREAAARLAMDYLRVGISLLDKEWERTDRREPGPVSREIMLVEAAAGVATSPLLKYAIDYSQFKPRGFYTETPLLKRYFRAMSWYGLAGFRLIDDRETRCAMIIAEAFRSRADLRARWEEIDRVYSYLISPCDDLTPAEYADALAASRRKRGAGTGLERFRGVARALRDPRINSMVLTPAQMHDWPRLTKGMRFFGKRYLPDSEAFMHLTDPRVPGRLFPTGIDVMAANGSARAREMAAASPDARMTGYAQGAAKAATVFTELKEAASPSHYVESLKVAGTIAAPADARAPAFAKTVAYADKSVMSALATWASMRHTWLLHGKQSVICAGLFRHEPLPGYVEPNPRFFAAMRRLVERTTEILGDVKGVDVERFSGLAELVEKLSAMVGKELADEPFSEEEVSILDGYGNLIGRLQGFRFNMQADEHFPWMALIADVHSEMLVAKQCLEVGTGGAMPIYVAVEHGRQWQLLIGGVYSYYEFRQPFTERLTDEQWRRMWNEGRMPEMPPWTASFVATHDVDELIRRLRKGERVEQVLYVNDPELDAFLEEAARPGGTLSRSESYPWLLQVAAAKLGRKVAPVLFEMVRTADTGVNRVWKGELTKTFLGPAQAAAVALALVAGAEDLPALKEIVLGPDRLRAQYVVEAAVNMRDRCLEALLLAAFERKDLGRQHDRATREEGVYRMDFLSAIMRGLSVRASRDVTPALLDLWPRSDSEVKREILETLDKLWFDKRGPRTQALRSEATEAEIERWRRRIAQVVVQAIQGGDRRLVDSAIELAGHVRAANAVGAIDRASSLKRFPYRAPEALAMIGTDEAVDALVRLSHAEEAFRRGGVVEAMGKAGSRKAVPRLCELLDDKAPTNTNDFRVCDRAAEALATLLPDGPRFDIWNLKRDGRDAKIAEWKTHAAGVARALTAAEPPVDKAARLIKEAQTWERSEEFPRALGEYVKARRALVSAGDDARARELVQSVAWALEELSALEVELIVQRYKLLERDAGRRLEGGLDPLAPDFLHRRMHGAFKVGTMRFGPYLKLDPDRFTDAKAYLDAWGKPYVLRRPARHGAAPLEVYSFGPDGRDDEGGGDDVTSWRPTAGQRRKLLAGAATREVDPAHAWVLYVRGRGGSFIPGEEYRKEDVICKMDLGTREVVEIGRGQRPVWSPDGTKVAFYSRRDGNDEIYVMNADGSGVTRLTNHPASDQDPAWSPDGRRIAFSTSRRDPPGKRRGRPHMDIAIMNAYGTGVTLFPRERSYTLYGARWLTADAFLCYSSGSAALFRGSVRKGALERDSRFKIVLHASSSPDGGALAFRGRAEVIMVSREALRYPVNVTRFAGKNTHPVWAGSSRIVFASNRDGPGQFDLYLMRVDGSDVVRLTSTPDNEFPSDVFAPTGAARR